MEQDKTNSLKLNWLLLALFVILASTYAYIGLFQSVFYSVEVFLLPLVVVMAVIATAVLVWLNKGLRKYRFPIFLSIGSLLFTALIIQHYVETYKPTITIVVPENYEGMVYLFPSEYADSEVIISKNGIGYIPHMGQYQHEVYQGERNISDALNEYGSGNIEFSSNTPGRFQSIRFTCFEVELNRIYPTNPWNQKHAVCMNVNQFDSLVQLQIIDSSIIHKQTWDGMYE